MASVIRLDLRLPLLLLAAGDLGLLVARLRPWSALSPLPDLGAAGYDPMALLLAYLFFLLWIGLRMPRLRLVLQEAALWAIPAGVLASGVVLLAERPPGAALFFARMGLLLVASLFWGWAGARAEWRTGSPQQAMVAGLGSAMGSALLAVAILLARAGNFPREFLPGDAAFEALQGMLRRVTAFLLVLPPAGAMMGLFFASFSIHQEEKKLRAEEARRVLETRR